MKNTYGVKCTYCVKVPCSYVHANRINPDAFLESKDEMSQERPMPFNIYLLKSTRCKALC